MVLISLVCHGLRSSSSVKCCETGFSSVVFGSFISLPCKFCHGAELLNGLNALLPPYDGSSRSLTRLRKISCQAGNSEGR